MINQANSMNKTPFDGISDSGQFIGEERRKKQKLDLDFSKCKVCGDDSAGIHYGVGKLLIKLVKININTCLYEILNMQIKLRVRGVK